MPSLPRFDVHMCKAIFTISSEANNLLSFLSNTLASIKVLRLAMKVDERKHYDGGFFFPSSCADKLSFFSCFHVFLSRDFFNCAHRLDVKWKWWLFGSLSLASNAVDSQQNKSHLPSHWSEGENRKKSLVQSAISCWLTGIKLHISKSDDDSSEHFGSSFRYGGRGGGGIEKSGGGANPHSMSQSNLKSMSNFFHITIDS